MLWSFLGDNLAHPGEDPFPSYSESLETEVGCSKYFFYHLSHLNNFTSYACGLVFCLFFFFSLSSRALKEEKIVFQFTAGGGGVGAKVHNLVYNGVISSSIERGLWVQA